MFVISYNLTDDYGAIICTTEEDAIKRFNELENILKSYTEGTSLSTFQHSEDKLIRNSTCYIECDDCCYEGQFYWVKCEFLKI